MGVLTKPDLVDKGSEGGVLRVFLNKIKPLKHGYVMVKNRSQKELNQETSLEQLTEGCTHLLVEQIESALPSMRKEIDDEYDATKNELYALGDAPPDTTSSRRAAANEIIRAWGVSMRRVACQADYCELPENDNRFRLLLRERRSQFDVYVFVSAKRLVRTKLFS